jgi:N-acetylmuramoyl-L-alanine amidase
MQIVWRGNEYTNSSSRDGQVPIGICDHISAGSMSSMRSWFTSPDNEVSSAHYGVSKSGEIDQYVDLRRMAWTQGITADRLGDVMAQIVKDYCAGCFVNPNKFLVGIEHEGTDGQLTEAQLEASIWLHGHIRDEIASIWGEDYYFPLNSYTVVGHFQIDPKRKPLCPGPYFPWQALYTSLWEMDNMAKDNEQDVRIGQLEGKVAGMEQTVRQLEALRDIEAPEWAMEAAAYFGPYMATKTGSYDFWRNLTIQYRMVKGQRV